jgi:hypothetical protein
LIYLTHAVSKNMAKYEVWGRKEIGRGKRQRLAHGLASETRARRELEKLKAEGYKDAIITQRPPTYGGISGIQRQGRTE